MLVGAGAQPPLLPLIILRVMRRDSVLAFVAPGVQRPAERQTEVGPDSFEKPHFLVVVGRVVPATDNDRLKCLQLCADLIDIGNNTVKFMT